MDLNMPFDGYDYAFELVAFLYFLKLYFSFYFLHGMLND